MKRRTFLVCTAALFCSAFLAVGCTQKISQPVLQQIEYSNLADSDTQDLLSKLLQDAVQRFGIGGQILKPLLLKKSLWNAVERKQLSGLSVKVVKGHTILSRMKKQRWFIDMVDKSSI